MSRFLAHKECLAMTAGIEPQRRRAIRTGDAPQQIAAVSLSLGVIDISNRLTHYQEAWDLQKQLLRAVLASEDTSSPAGYLLLVQHQPVFTLGSGSSLEHLGFDPSSPPFPLFRTERGGEVTYHGPGQLVAYPIINLRLFNQDLHWYLRSLEEVIIRCLDEVSGLHGERITGLTGVWVGGKKVAAIGVRAQRWVTYHGFAINLANDLRPFQLITPCGISDRTVTSVKELLRPSDFSAEVLTPTEDEPLNVRALDIEDAGLVSEYAYALKYAFADSFSVGIHDAELREALLLCNTTAEETASAALGL
ncbi:g12849 [Coccomyxa viridis]|uniref:lipoyl(octanoyl) transferase n=1 Tax=Coccomyxa viridis TaxID=1274662 RepID=A0ABP1GFI6_9CHLO